MADTLCVYIIHDTNGVAYIGQTNDLARRLHEHNSGQGADFTRKHRLSRWYLAWSQNVKDRAEARCMERYLTQCTAYGLPLPVAAKTWGPTVHRDHFRHTKRVADPNDTTTQMPTRFLVWKNGKWTDRGRFYRHQPLTTTAMRAMQRRLVVPIEQPFSPELDQRITSLKARAQRLGLTITTRESSLTQTLTLRRTRQDLVLRRADDPDAIETALDIYEAWPLRDFTAYPIKPDERPRDTAADSIQEPPPGRAPREMNEQQLSLILVALQHFEQTIPRTNDNGRALVGLSFTTRAQIERELDGRRAATLDTTR